MGRDGITGLVPTGRIGDRQICHSAQKARLRSDWSVPYSRRRQNVILAATWRMRGGTRVELITPKEAEVWVAFGWLKFTLLKTLKASPRISNLMRSVMAKILCRAKSVWKKPGPVKMLRPAP